MKVVLLFLFVIGHSWAVDIREYKQEQKNSIRTMSYKKDKPISNSINIIFYKDFNDVSTLETSYPIKLKKCIIKRICIFDILDSTIDIRVLIQEIKKKTKGIKSIQPYRKYYFREL